MTGFEITGSKSARGLEVNPLYTLQSSSFLTQALFFPKSKLADGQRKVHVAVTNFTQTRDRPNELPQRKFVEGLETKQVGERVRNDGHDMRFLGLRPLTATD